jgi:polyphosphate kinase
MKMNSLTDRDVIDKIVEAVRAGVKVMMVIRGITCIVDVDGSGEGLIIRQIVGRFLEHARVYAFGAEVDTVYLSSADMMTRNTEHRVEIAYPVLDPTCRALVLQYMNIQLADNVKARQLNSEGKWEKLEVEEGAPRVDSQHSLIVLAYDRARKAAENMDVPLVPESSVVPPIPEVLHGLPLDDIVVAESLPEEESVAPVEDDEHKTEVWPESAFVETTQEAKAAPVPSLISRAHERVQERVQERAQERAQAIASATDATTTTTETVQPTPAQPKKGRLNRALGLFGAGIRTLFRGE